MKTAAVLTATALAASYLIYALGGIWSSFWFGVAVGMAVSAYHVHSLWRLFGHTECSSLDEAAAYAFSLSANYIGIGALLTIPYTVLWNVHLPSLLVYTVWAYVTALSYVALGYIAAGVLLIAFSVFTYFSLYGSCAEPES